MSGGRLSDRLKSYSETPHRVQSTLSAISTERALYSCHSEGRVGYFLAPPLAAANGRVSYE